MKKVLFMALTATTLLFASCSKKSSDPQPQVTNKVTINGTDYATVKIGTQTWTTVNYNGDGGKNYNNSNVNNAAYGKFYTLAEAKAISLPSGWRLPTKADVEKLLVYLGATGKAYAGSEYIGVEGDATVSVKLKSKTDWTNTEGNNSSGFNAYPTGDGLNNVYEYINGVTHFWTSTIDSDNDQYIFTINNLKDGPDLLDQAGIDFVSPAGINSSRISIRFVRDN